MFTIISLLVLPKEKNIFCIQSHNLFRFPILVSIIFVSTQLIKYILHSQLLITDISMFSDLNS